MSHLKYNTGIQLAGASGCSGVKVSFSCFWSFLFMKSTFALLINLRTRETTESLNSRMCFKVIYFMSRWLMNKLSNSPGLGVSENFITPCCCPFGVKKGGSL
jgi:hypothetical protein